MNLVPRSIILNRAPLPGRSSCAQLTRLVKHQRRGAPWEERPESKAKVYRYIENEVANWLCNVLPSPHVEVWVDERKGHGWQLYERVNLDDLAKAGVDVQA